MDLRSNDEIAEVGNLDSGFFFVPHEHARRETVSHSAALKKLVILEKNMVPGLMQVATSKLQPGSIIEPHRHATMAEIFHLVSGELHSSCDNVDLLLREGDSLVVLPGTEHSFRASSNTELFYFSLQANPT